MHVIVTCENYRKMPKTLRLCETPDKVTFEIKAGKTMARHDNQVWLLDAKIITPGKSMQDLYKNAENLHGLLSGNQANINRITIYTETITIIMALDTNGIICETIKHGLT